MAFTIKQILLSNAQWWTFYQKNKHRIRQDIVHNIVRLLSCRHPIRGFQTYRCSNPLCTHIKKVPFTCKSRGCSSCGKKATHLWIQKQNQQLPNTTWQHITFTMPSILWDFFWYNRHLLTQIAPIAARTILNITDKKKIIPAIFLAIHTFGRDLKRNIHLHVSTTLGGLTLDGTQWKTVYIKVDLVMRQWRYQVIRLLRREYQSGRLIIPTALQKTLSSPQAVNDFFDQQYQKKWIVHASKPCNHYRRNVNYIARYLKRPPIAQSRLVHYDGNEVVFKFLNHTTQRYARFRCSTEEFIQRFIQHIPDRGFRLIRYYGILANRVRSIKLPQAFCVLQQTPAVTSSSNSWVTLMQREFQMNPLRCLLCGCELILQSVTFGLSINSILLHHSSLALMRKIPI